MTFQFFYSTVHPQADLFLHSILLYPLKSQDNPQAHSQALSGSFFYFLLPFLSLVSLIFPLSSIFSLSLLNFFPSLPTLSLSLITFSSLSTPPSPSGLEIGMRFPHPTFFLPPKKWKRCQEGQGVLFLGGGFPQSACFHELSSSLTPHEAWLLQFVLITFLLPVSPIPMVSSRWGRV